MSETMVVTVSQWQALQNAVTNLQHSLVNTQNSLTYVQGNFSKLQAWSSAVMASSPAQALSSGQILNSGDTAWMLTSTALVLLMTLPGVALFYGGMCQTKNVLSSVLQSYCIACMITVLWFMMSYSLCFSNGSVVYGNADRFWLVGTNQVTVQDSTYRLGINSAHLLAPSVPESVFMTYQLTFAIITATLVCGAFAERMRFHVMVIFIFFWHFLVYCPVCHSSWALDGWLNTNGDLDFAGGNVVHICSGFSGLAASLVIGPRKDWGIAKMKPANVIHCVIGGALLWVGWFGFNAGSSLRAAGLAGFAMMVTQICAGTSGLAWMAAEYLHKGRPSVLGIVSGTVAGLVIITPASGYVDQTGAFIMGLLGTPAVYWGIQAKQRLGYDDALDAFGVHGVAGMCGGFMLGFFANPNINPGHAGAFYGHGVQVGLQLMGIVPVAAWSFSISMLILLIMRQFLLLRVSEEHEERGLDYMEQGATLEDLDDYDALESGGPNAFASLSPKAAAQMMAAYSYPANASLVLQQQLTSSAVASGSPAIASAGILDEATAAVTINGDRKYGRQGGILEGMA